MAAEKGGCGRIRNLYCETNRVERSQIVKKPEMVGMELLLALVV